MTGSVNMAKLTPARTDHGRTTSAAAAPGKFVTFFLGGEEYGVAILKVREIIAATDITRVPGMAPHVRGVINLRGAIVPVIDTRQRLGMEPVAPTSQSCIIVVQAQNGETGLLVERVSEVLDIAADGIVESPSFTAEVDTRYLAGIATMDGTVRLLLDVDAVLAPPEQSALTG